VTTPDRDVRPATEGDLPALNAIYNHYVKTSHATFDIEPKSIEWREAWFRDHASSRHRIYVATLDDRVAGFASSGPYRARPAYDTSVETTVYVSPDCVGRGIGVALYSALFEVLAQEDVHRALAGIALPNEPSVALHRKFGFRQAGRFTEQGRKFGRYWDVAWFERPIGP
jgi:phosphinothricin acetyltransferase